MKSDLEKGIEIGERLAQINRSIESNDEKFDNTIYKVLNHYQELRREVDALKEEGGVHVIHTTESNRKFLIAWMIGTAIGSFAAAVISKWLLG